jgi:hypothetical protein
MLGGMEGGDEPIGRVLTTNGNVIRWRMTGFENVEDIEENSVVRENVTTRKSDDFNGEIRHWKFEVGGTFI